MNLQFARMILAIALVQLRFGIKQVHLARPAMLKKADDRLGTRFKVGKLGSQGGGLLVCRTRITAEQMRQGEGAKPASGSAEECSPVKRIG